MAAVGVNLALLPELYLKKTELERPDGGGGALLNHDHC
jgi:hypothetical protein